MYNVYLLFTFNLSSDTAGDSGTGGDTDLAAGTLSSGPSSNGIQQFCLTNMPWLSLHCKEGIQVESQKDSNGKDQR